MRLILQSALLSLTLISGSLMAATATENLERLLNPIQSLSADFQQLILDHSGTRLQSSNGRVELMKPGFFRWETLEPFPQLIVSNGETLWLYDQDLEQVTQQKVDQRISHTPALLLSGDMSQLQANFSVSGPTSGDDGLFRLTPKEADPMYEVLRILFVKGVPAEMQLEDSLGQQTSLQFQNTQINPELDQNAFTFEIPEGVDLIVE